jgi:transposase
MASIIKKKIKNKTYYYYVESKRVDGKPRHVNQKYLGTAETIFEKLSKNSNTREPLYSIILEFADVCILYDIATRLNIVDIINKHTTKRNQGATIGEYALIAAINRATLPKSKSCVASWYEQTILSRLLPVKTRMLTPQNYWNHMRIDDESINAIEGEIVKKIVDQYQIDTSHLIYDATNFYTYIDTKQDSELAKRGHCKSKRNDLKIVSLSMMVTPDCNIPLLYDTYPGNVSDSKQFAVMLDKLKKRYERLTCRNADITVVFDRGNNSQDNIDLLENEDFPLYYVGGLKRNQCADLYEYGKEAFTQLTGNDFGKATAFRVKKIVYKREMTVVVVYNPVLYDGQMQGILGNIEKTNGKFNDLQARLLNRAEGVVTKGRAPTQASVEKQLKAILATEFMNDIFDYEMTTYNAIPFFSYSLNIANLETLKNTLLGKTVLFTNRHNWTIEEITAAYRSAWHIEHAFRQMKDTDHLTVRPLFHWTDEKIKIHIFYCVLAYRLCCLLKKELLAAGISESINYILEELNTIKYVITIFGTSGSDIVCSFSKGTALAESIATLYGLKEIFLPKTPR